MEIKEALKFIFLNAGKINKLSDDFFVPATQLLVIYNIYLKKKTMKFIIHGFVNCVNK
jgi:hypothetical protein